MLYILVIREPLLVGSNRTSLEEKNPLCILSLGSVHCTEEEVPKGIAKKINESVEHTKVRSMRCVFGKNQIAMIALGKAIIAT